MKLDIEYYLEVKIMISFSTGGLDMLIRYVIGVKSGITYVFSYNYAMIKSKIIHMILCL